jgi:phenylpyruvate tautomerase PptA (4-oxalocrotonate tautomerase family)
MPVVTITVRQSKPVDFKTGIVDAVHAALASAGVRQAELLQGLIEFDEENFLYDPRFPDVRTERTNDFVLVEIVLGNECGIAARQEIVSNLAGQLNARGYNPDNVKVVFQAAPWENWVPAGDGSPLV